MDRLGANVNLLLIDWGVAVRTLAGEAACGDAHLVKQHAGGALLAVVDGVGHGGEAEAATRIALTILDRHFHEPVISLVQRCHEALADTRGVVMTLAALDAVAGTLTWLGVGNVEGRLFRAGAGIHSPESVLLRGGLVGFQLPELHASILSLAPGDLLVFATDGVAPGFAGAVSTGTPPQQLATRMMEGHFKGTDDALVLAVRYLGNRPESWNPS